MRHPHDDLLIETMTMMVLLAILFLAVTGCATNVDKVLSLEPPVKCRSLDLPPVPQDVKLDIFGDKIEANAGGEQLLRGYAACRSLYKPAP